jgi:hypothetical protein
MELAWRAIFEEHMLILLEQQCLATQMTWLQLYLMWEWYYNEEDRAKVEEQARMGNTMLERLYKETREAWAREEVEWRLEGDCGEGTSTGVEKWRAERKEMVREDEAMIVEIEDSEGDGDGSETDEIEDGEVEEVQGKGKGKEKVMKENTLA